MDFCKAKIIVFRGATAFAKAEAECQTVALACVMRSFIIYDLIPILSINHLLFTLLK